MTEFGGGEGFFPPFPDLGNDILENPVEKFLGKVSLGNGLYAYITIEKDAIPPVATFELNLQPLQELLGLDEFPPDDYQAFSDYVRGSKDEVRRFVSRESLDNFVTKTGFVGDIYYDFDTTLWYYVFVPS